MCTEPSSDGWRASHASSQVKERIGANQTTTRSKISSIVASALFRAMLVHGPKLERQQVLLGRFVEIATELFAITATCSRAEALIASGAGGDKREMLGLVDYFCRSARLRIGRNFHGLRHNTDRGGYRLAQAVLAGKHQWIEKGIVGRMD